MIDSSRKRCINHHPFNPAHWKERAPLDVEAANAFHTALLGWAAPTAEHGYTVWMNNGRMNGGMMQMDEQWSVWM